jgi:acyl-CoA synthetase (AMP-forming)/AMP-acid ligase II
MYQQNLADPIRAHGRYLADKAAIIYKDRTITYGELNARSNRLANALLGLGFKKGDKVTLMAKNCGEFAEVVWGLAKAGLVLVLLNVRFVKDEITHIVNDSHSKGLIFDGDLEEQVFEVKDSFEHLKKNGLIVISEGTKGNAISYEDLLQKASDQEPDVPVFGIDPCHIGYTSGTTGKPKGAVMTHFSDIFRNLAAYYNYPRGFDSSSIALAAGPLYHAGPLGYLVSPLIGGGTVVIQKDFDPEVSVKLIDQYKITSTWLVPTMIGWIVSLPADFLRKFNLSSLRVLSTAGSHLHRMTLDKIYEAFPEANHYDFYGSTEAGMVTFIEKKEKLKRAESVGRPAFMKEMKLCTKEGKEVKQGEIGEIWVRPPYADEYYNNPQATRESFTKDGWFKTGDMGRFDEDGYAYIVDRKSDMIISGGVNVYPLEIETILKDHPKVEEVAVIGIPDKKWGETVRGVIYLKPDEWATDEEVKSFCEGKMARFKIPKSFDFVDSPLPKSSTGKILKRVIKEEYWKGHGKKIA